VNILELIGLTKVFDKTIAVEDLSIGVESGSFTMLVGPSGCGKTTTLRLVAGFEQPDGGTIKLRGTEISSPRKVLAPNERDMGMVFQSYATWPHLTVFENIVFGLRSRRHDKKSIDDRYEWVCDLLSLGGLEQRYPYQLSGGQQQRVSLARALVTKPAVLLLDEPLSNLDEPMRAVMRVELRRIQRQTGITFVYVTHDQQEALSMADRVLIMHQGRLEQDGTPRDVYERPATPFVARFMGRANLLAGVLTSKTNGVGSVDVPGCGSLDGHLVGSVELGEQVVVVVRKERLELEANPGVNVLHGEVIDAFYYGSETEMVVQLSGSTQISLRQNDTRVLQRRAGDTVSVSFRPEDALILRGTTDEH
jgi:ABC-type Fe3+/spermidine/putrescine transport system ATPase subunit